MFLDRFWNALVDAFDWIGDGIKRLGRGLKAKIVAFLDFIER